MPERDPGRIGLTGDAQRILAVQALRGFAYGLGSILIGVTLARRGLSGWEVGLVLAALLAGVAVTSLAVTRTGDRVGRRRWYRGLLLVMAGATALLDVEPQRLLLVYVAVVSQERL